MRHQIHLNNLFEKIQKDERTPVIVGAIIILFILLTLFQIGTSIDRAFQKTPLIEPDKMLIHKLPDISEFHLFGIFDDSLRNLPETRLQLLLEGTVVNTDNPAYSYAIISAPDEPAKIYKIGQTVPGGAIVRHIMKDQIIIEDNGSLESLKLPIPPPLEPSNKE